LLAEVISNQLRVQLLSNAFFASGKAFHCNEKLVAFEARDRFVEIDQSASSRISSTAKVPKRFQTLDLATLTLCVRR